MKICDKEYHFQMTVRARLEIAKTLPGHDMNEIPKTFRGSDDVKSLELLGVMAEAMSRGYAMRQAQETGAKYDPEQVLKADLVLDLLPDELEQLNEEIVSAYLAGTKTEIETEPVDKKKSQKKTGEKT